MEAGMDHVYHKARLRSKNQVTLPPETRSLLGAQEGDDLLFYQNDQGQVGISRAQVIPPDQAWFWTERWQKMERAAQADIDAGRVRDFDSADEMIAWLDNEEDDEDACCAPAGASKKPTGGCRPTSRPKPRKPCAC
jgi:bifunctional DNA-binding transcriptional regulator/antitoxin component of YhaV-PrlF toxin-antitoxin module